jgi:PAS domain S-box-containing protein
MNQSIESLDLERQIESLRQQLEDAEELHRAISNGEVDAFVVGRSDDNKRVLMLSGAYARYRQLVEDMHQGAVTVSQSGEIMFANHSFAAMVGLAPIDLFRVPLTHYLAPADAANAGALLQPRGGKAEIKAMLQGTAGKQHLVRISLVSANDDFITLLVTERDPTEEDEAGATVDAIRTGAVDALVVGGEQVVLLDSAQRFYQAAVDRMQQGVVIIGPQGEIVYANQRMAVLLGVNRERLAQSSLLKLAHSADAASVQALLNGRHSASAQAEVRLRRADNEYVTTLLTVTAIADRQKMCLVSDLSLQKRHEAAEERQRKFLGMMAHEFRNILAPIRNSVDFLQRQDGLDAECRKMVEIVDRQSARMLALVEDLRRINSPE